jgi:hypothetical protein
MQLDVALLAATLDFELRLFFNGASVMQLVPRSNTAAAQLPPAYRAWGSLPDLFESADLRAYAERAWLERLQLLQLHPCLPLQASTAEEMRHEWAACDRVMVL